MLCIWCHYTVNYFFCRLKCKCTEQRNSMDTSARGYLSRARPSMFTFLFNVSLKIFPKVVVCRLWWLYLNSVHAQTCQTQKEGLFKSYTRAMHTVSCHKLYDLLSCSLLKICSWLRVGLGQNMATLQGSRNEAHSATNPLPDGNP